MAPVAKVGLGGLGDVVTGLGKALQKREHLVEIIIPKYDCMQNDRVSNLRAKDEIKFFLDGKLHNNKIWAGTVEGLTVYFIEPGSPVNYFSRGQFHSENDDFKRFSYFSRAALELAPLYRNIYASKGLNSARICFACHNFENQGTAIASELASCGLDVSQLNIPDRLQDNSAYDRINLVKILMHGTRLLINFSKLDSMLMSDDLQGKNTNKLNLREHLKLSSDDPMVPLVGCVTSLVPRKGVPLIKHAMYQTMELGGQFVLLGSSPVDHIQREFEGIAKQFENHPHIRLILKYDEALSHSIYAASDMFIIPSVFEPCGVTQMIAIRYGSVPITRKTGGLNDSVFDIEDEDLEDHQIRNGFTFLDPDEKAASKALERAFSHYNQNRKRWEQLVQRIMKINFSWDSCAIEYAALYEESVEREKAMKRQA